MIYTRSVCTVYERKVSSHWSVHVHIDTCAHIYRHIYICACLNEQTRLPDCQSYLMLQCE